MTIRLVIAALAGAMGLLIAARGLRPTQDSLGDRLARSAVAGTSQQESALRSVWARIGVWLIRRLQADRLEKIEADLAVNQTDLKSLAVDKLNSSLGMAVLAAFVSYVTGVSRSPGGLAAVAIAGAVGGYLLPDVENSSKAASRREEFSESLSAFISLVAVCISGGGGVNSAMSDALDMGGDWSFQVLRQALAEANLAGEDAWVAFDRLGRSLQIEDLIELAGALGLAGSSGAQVTETLRARAESGRDRDRQAVLQAAHRRSERMNMPIAALALSWMAFVGYAAITGVIAG